MIYKNTLKRSRQIIKLDFYLHLHNKENFILNVLRRKYGKEGAKNYKNFSISRTKRA